MKKSYKGELEIDMEEGTIYFHSQTGRTIFRLKGLPATIPEKAFYDVLVKEAEVSWEPTSSIEVGKV